MEGSDVKTLIAKRMGITKGEVESKLVSLHQKGELDGTADRSSGPSDSNVSGNISLTAKDLEDFERSEAEARNGTQTGTPFKLALKPAVLGNPATPRTPRTPRTPPAPTQPPPAPSAPAPPTPTASAPPHPPPVPRPALHICQRTLNLSPPPTRPSLPPCSIHLPPSPPPRPNPHHRPPQFFLFVS